MFSFIGMTVMFARPIVLTELQIFQEISERSKLQVQSALRIKSKRSTRFLQPMAMIMGKSTSYYQPHTPPVNN